MLQQDTRTATEQLTFDDFKKEVLRKNFFNPFS